MDTAVLAGVVATWKADRQTARGSHVTSNLLHRGAPAVSGTSCMMSAMAANPHAEELARAEAECARVSDLCTAKDAELEDAEAELERLEGSDDSTGTEIDEADRAVERLREEADELARELQSATDYFDEIDRRYQDHENGS